MAECPWKSSPTLAHDTQATIAQAMELWKNVDRPNLMVKIPATLAGIPAITEVISHGISVNVTLIFSLDRYRAVIAAYLAGAAKALEAGHDISHIHSVASFFVSRVDSAINPLLDALGTPEAIALKSQQRSRMPGWHTNSLRSSTLPLTLSP